MTTQTITQEAVKQAAEAFIAQWNEKFTAYYQKAYPNNEQLWSHVTLTTQGKKYWRIVESDGFDRSGSCAGFIDTTTGDVLFSGGWKAPAKHARGNVFAEDNGLSALDLGGRPHVRYLK